MIDHLSCSQVTLYLACPRKYAYRYIEGVEPAGKPAGLAVGSVVHSTIEWLHQQRIAGRTAIGLEEFLRIFEADWAALTVDTVLLKDGDTEKDLVGQAWALLRLYAEKPSPNPVVAVEVSFRLPLVHPATGETMDVPLEGRIDQVEEGPGKKPTVVELKTAARRYSEDDIARQLQLTAYEWAFEVEHGEIPELRLDLLLKTKRPQLLRHRVTRTVEDRKRFFTLAKAVFDGITKEVFPPNPGWACTGCEYGHVCPWGKVARASAA